MSVAESKTLLLLTPPLTQVNTPYPATTVLKGFLDLHAMRWGIRVAQVDPTLDLILDLFSVPTFQLMLDRLPKAAETDPLAKYFQSNRKQFEAVLPAMVHFLQGKDPGLALRIVQGTLFPRPPRYQKILGSLEDPTEYLDWAFGALGLQDRAKFLASMVLDDLSELITHYIDPEFGFSRYGEKLAASQPTFDPLLRRLASPPSFVEERLDIWAREQWELHKPWMIALSVPFPGNVPMAFRLAQIWKTLALQEGRILTIVFGGGYANTELRELADPRVFDVVDYICLDDGERPLFNLIEHCLGTLPESKLVRTFHRKAGAVVWTDCGDHDVPHADRGTPTYAGLKTDCYLSIVEFMNPMHRLWSDTRWNKLTLAHGCYWKKCNFCDISLDYIGRYDPAPVDRLVDQMVSLIRETGSSGFHWVDEAAPPVLLRQLSKHLIDRGVVATWWGNIRFEKTFNADLTRLMAEAGCVAVSGGLEVASDRLLKLMNKGVTVPQVARVTRAFQDAGVLVHAYLMYGFPSETILETVESLERVRQLFIEGCITSAFWHRFSVTAHSPVGKNPADFQVQLLEQPLRPGQSRFARNDLPFRDTSESGAAPDELDWIGKGLHRAIYNYMQGMGLEEDVRSWFEGVVPKPNLAKDLVQRALSGSGA